MAKQSSLWWHSLLPQHAISRIMGFFAGCRCKYLKNWGIHKFIKHFGVDMSLAEQEDYKQYSTFNAFFTRHLKPGARTIDPDEKQIISPVDGTISELGVIEGNKILQAKGQHYTVSDLLGGDDEFAKLFEQGRFMTVYLSPKDYHRFHMPVGGRLLEMRHVPGRLFSVNPNSVNQISRLFARNERAVCLFKTDIGHVAMIPVGAMIVGSIATTWHGVVTPPTKRRVRSWQYSQEPITLARGDEMGYFKMGSTVIMLFEKDKMDWSSQLKAGDTIKMGESIGTIQ
jgi:phosphatidylserine decarboxylase